MYYSKSLTHKKVLRILFYAILVSSMFMLAGCEKEFVSERAKNEVEFPLDEKGYPQNNVVMINNKAYPIDLESESRMGSEIEVKMNEDTEILEIVLPQYLPINYWSLEEKEYLNLLFYTKIDFPIKNENMVE